ncbi:MAG: hypothetical protein QXG98_02905 [Candidatus Micrarchaeia archaeon]
MSFSKPKFGIADVREQRTGSREVQSTFMKSHTENLQQQIEKQLRAGGVYRYTANELAKTAVKIGETRPEKIDAICKAFDELAKVTPKLMWAVCRLLEDSAIAEFFVKETEVATNALKEMLKAKNEGRIKEDGWMMLNALTDAERVTELFIKHTQAFARIANTAKYPSSAFKALANPPIAELFDKASDKVVEAFENIAQATGEEAREVFGALQDEKARMVTEMFIQYAEDKVALDALLKEVKAWGQEKVAQATPAKP